MEIMPNSKYFEFILFWSSCLSQRKPDEESSSTVAQDTEAPVKRARQEDDQPEPPVITENGHVPNGGVTSSEQKQKCYHIL